MRFRRLAGLVCFAGIIAGVWFFVFHKESHIFGFDENTVRMVWVEDEGVRLPYRFSGRKTVADFLREKHLWRDRSDVVGLPLGRVLFGGETVEIDREKSISVAVGDARAESVVTTRRVARDAVADVGISMGIDDFILPSPDAILFDESVVEVVRVVVTEEVEAEPIAFATKVTEDNEMGWREKKVTVKGEKGVREKKYKVVSHNGEVVKKTLLSNEITKEPVTEEVVQGTYVKLGKKHTGLGTWYAHTGTLAAASPWLPMGSYAKVTNTANGKSVIVKINDRGPFGTNRIIDLDKVAFAKIASLGAGVVDVKVEEVLN